MPRRFGRRARGRAPEAGGDSGNAPGAVRPGKSLLFPEIRAAGPRPGRAAAVGVAARPGGPARRGAPSARGHRRAAEREQERSRRRRPRGYTFSMFPTRPEVRTTRTHADMSSLPSLPHGPR